MFIAFEGPDNVGKSTSAANLASSGEAFYNVIKLDHEHIVATQDGNMEPDWTHTYDRIDWLTHMVYRLALPERDWNDDRPRTVFAMPDTHLVFKIHRPDLAQYISDELYKTGTLAKVNPMYWYFANFFMQLNETREFALFKTVSIIEVANDPRDGTFTQMLQVFSSPVQPTVNSHVDTDEKLLELLREDDRQRI